MAGGRVEISETFVKYAHLFNKIELNKYIQHKIKTKYIPKTLGYANYVSLVTN